jgi:Gpi18-like mannosyltransferase
MNQTDWIQVSRLAVTYTFITIKYRVGAVLACVFFFLVCLFVKFKKALRKTSHAFPCNAMLLVAYHTPGREMKSHDAGI